MSTSNLNWNMLPILKACCYKILPSVYTTSISYEEQVNYLYKSLNELIENNNNVPDLILQTIKEYIDSGVLSDALKEIIGEFILNVKLPPAGITPAKGDGVADDTDSFTRILTYAKKNNKCVYVPGGAYIISPINIPEGVSLFGDCNKECRLVMKGGTLGNFITMDDYSAISNLNIDCNKSNKIGNVNCLNVGSNCGVVNCVLSNSVIGLIANNNNIISADFINNNTNCNLTGSKNTIFCKNGTIENAGNNTVIDNDKINIYKDSIITGTLTTSFNQSDGIKIDNESPSNNSVTVERVAKGTKPNTQLCGILNTTMVEEQCANNEVGIMSLLHDSSINPSNENVGIYAQSSAIASCKHGLWGMVSEVKDCWQNDLFEKNDTNVPLCGIEVDVATHFSYAQNQTLGISLNPYGGGECSDAILVNNNNAPDGTYNSGLWRNGINVRPGSINGTQGFCLYLQSDCGQGIAHTGKADISAEGFHGSGTSAINVDGSYLIPIAILNDKPIKLNGIGNNEAISFKQSINAIDMESNAISLSSHITTNEADAGGVSIPGTCGGYIQVYVNGYLKKIPFFN